MAGLRKSLDHAIKSLSEQRTAIVNVTGAKLLKLSMAEAILRSIQITSELLQEAIEET